MGPICDSRRRGRSQVAFDPTVLGQVSLYNTFDIQRHPLVRIAMHVLPTARGLSGAEWTGDQPDCSESPAKAALSDLTGL